MIARKLCEFRCGQIAAVRPWGDPASGGEITIYDCRICGSYGIARSVECTFTGQEPRDVAVERQFLLLRPAFIKSRPAEGTIGVFDLKEDGSGVQLAFLPRPS